MKGRKERGDRGTRVVENGVNCLPGVNLPAMGVAPTYLPNLRTARWAMGLEETTKTSAGFSMAAMALAAKINFSQVLFKLMMFTPSALRLKTYWAIVVSELREPKCVVAASNLHMSPSCKQSDQLGVKTDADYAVTRSKMTAGHWAFEWYLPTFSIHQDLPTFCVFFVDDLNAQLFSFATWEEKKERANRKLNFAHSSHLLDKVMLLTASYIL